MWQVDRSKVTLAQTHARRDTQLITQARLLGGPWELEICGSLDHADRTSYLHHTSAVTLRRADVSLSLASDTGNSRGPCGRLGARGQHVGDPWLKVQFSIQGRSTSVLTRFHKLMSTKDKEKRLQIVLPFGKRKIYDPDECRVRRKGRSPGSLSLDALFDLKADDRKCGRDSKHLKYLRLQITQQGHHVCFGFSREGY